MRDNTLIVSEKFYSLQGEGQTMGYPAIFLRLAGCNILCKSEHWICDTIEVWRKGKATDFQKVFTRNEINKLREGVHLVITGGEPLLHQKKLSEYLSWFVTRYKFLPTIEIETNGTIIPEVSLSKFVEYWNCSPKLANSGVPEKNRINTLAISKINSFEKSIFKFVVKDPSDMRHAIHDYGAEISSTKIMFMPAGETKEKLDLIRKNIIEKCILFGFRYCDRLHILTWNQKTGV